LFRFCFFCFFFLGHIYCLSCLDLWSVCLSVCLSVCSWSLVVAPPSFRFACSPSTVRPSPSNEQTTFAASLPRYKRTISLPPARHCTALHCTALHCTHPSITAFGPCLRIVIIQRKRKQQRRLSNKSESSEPDPSSLKSKPNHPSSSTFFGAVFSLARACAPRTLSRPLYLFPINNHLLSSAPTLHPPPLVHIYIPIMFAVARTTKTTSAAAAFKRSILTSSARAATSHYSTTTTKPTFARHANFTPLYRSTPTPRFFSNTRTMSKEGVHNLQS
jgi:hypothetical protein